MLPQNPSKNTNQQISMALFDPTHYLKLRQIDMLKAVVDNDKNADNQLTNSSKSLIKKASDESANTNTKNSTSPTKHNKQYQRSTSSNPNNSQEVNGKHKEQQQMNTKCEIRDPAAMTPAAKKRLNRKNRKIQENNNHRQSTSSSTDDSPDAGGRNRESQQKIKMTKLESNAAAAQSEKKDPATMTPAARKRLNRKNRKIQENQRKIEEDLLFRNLDWLETKPKTQKKKKKKRSKRTSTQSSNDSAQESHPQPANDTQINNHRFAIFSHNKLLTGKMLTSQEIESMNPEDIAEIIKLLEVTWSEVEKDIAKGNALWLH